ncbi:MAG TPA: aromatic ring-hydroxylating dioxygenase subunit alpha [Candidatus Eisenbacteria bacterium]|nr:aromatic ring-hydroxylating dioxygenase subunit alpha [Candidatus Eisenbacteria bacterium]
MDAREAIAVDPDITRAATLPARAYSDPALFARARERVFAPAWQFVADARALAVPGQALPVTLLEGLLDEPLLLTRDRDDRLHCLSNVCTHRGTLVCESAGIETALRCRYHGRRFALDGRFLSLPGFEGAAGFPSPADDLPRVACEPWGGLLFASLAPATPFADLVQALEARCGFLPLAGARLDPARSRDYLVHANWALYCDNYLEGLHVPHVHPELARALDTAAYRTELFPHAVLQTGIAADGEQAFALPAGHPDAGRRVAAWWWWLWPNTMLNFYPWGLSLNVVRPLAVDRTKVSFLAFVWDASRLAGGAGGAVDRVEREDEAVVESVQRGTRARLHSRGRYSPAHERGVHHFHRLLAAALAD